jgi:hypothetical protein
MFGIKRREFIRAAAAWPLAARRAQQAATFDNGEQMMGSKIAH